MSTVAVGDLVPDFTAEVTGGKTLRLEDLKGHNVILYFYPKDNTPGCTQEGIDFRDHYPEFAAHDAVILGVSRDSLKSHESFKAKHRLPFELISDPDEALCNLFGVIRLKNMYGKPVRGIERSTFLIDRTGHLVREWRKVAVKGHAQQVLEALHGLERPL